MNIILTILVFIILIIFLFSLKINEKFKCDSGKYKKILIHDLNLQFKEGDTGTTVDTKYFKNYTDEALFNNIIKTMNTILNNTVSFSLFKLLDEDVYKNMEYYYKFKGSGTPEIVDDYKIREFMNKDIEELQTLLNNPIENVGTKTKENRITTLLRMMINNQHFNKLKTNEDIIHIVLIPCFYNYTKNEIMVFEHLGEKYILLSLYKKQDNRYVRTLKSIDYDELSYNWVHGHISNKHKKDIFEKKNKNLSDEKKRKIDDYNNKIKLNNDSIKKIQENPLYITLIKEKTELDKKIKILRKNITDLIETNYYSDQRVLKLRKFRGKKIDAELFPELYIEHINTITPETLLKKKRELNKGFKDRPAIVITYKTLIEKQIAYLKKLDLVKINQYQSELELQETKIKNLMGKKIVISKAIDVTLAAAALLVSTTAITDGNFNSATAATAVVASAASAKTANEAAIVAKFAADTNSNKYNKNEASKVSAKAKEAAKAATNAKNAADDGDFENAVAYAYYAAKNAADATLVAASVVSGLGEVFVLTLEEADHGNGHHAEKKIIGVYDSKQEAVAAAGVVSASNVIQGDYYLKDIETKISEIQTKTEELNAKLKELYNETITCLERKRNQKVIDQLSGELSKTNKYIKDLYVPFNLCNILKNYIIIYGNTFKYTKLVNSVSMILNLQLFPLKTITFRQELPINPRNNYIDSSKFGPSSGATELITKLIADYKTIKDQKYENQELHLKEIKKNIIGELIKIKEDMVKFITVKEQILTQIYDGSKYELNNDIKNYQNSINPPQPGPHMDYLKSFKKSYI